MNSPKLFVVLLIVVCLPILAAGCQTTENKYNDCIKACEDEKSCLQYDSDVWSHKCLKYSDAECKNACIEKYK